MRNRNHLFKNKGSLFIGCLLFAISCLPGCTNKPEEKKTKSPVDYIRQIPGTSDSISAEIAAKGEVLIGYSDCYTCHKVEQRSTAPAFKDIAKRYPAKKIYIDMLAQKVISGGSRSWGYPVMVSHPQLSIDDAKLMVTYILSLKK